MAIQAATVISAIILGFLAGLLTFKRSLRWCHRCGQILSCADCAASPLPSHSTSAATAQRSGDSTV